jgi:hypothetical protein
MRDVVTVNPVKQLADMKGSNLKMEFLPPEKLVGGDDEIVGISALGRGRGVSSSRHSSSQRRFQIST